MDQPDQHQPDRSRAGTTGQDRRAAGEKRAADQARDDAPRERHGDRPRDQT